MEKIQLIVTDMDGTLLHHGNEVSEGNRKAFWDAWNQGIKLAICSGRSPKDVQSVVDNQKLPPCYILGYNGAHCIDLEGNLSAIHYVDPIAVEQCGAVFEKENVVYGIMNENSIALNNDPEDATFANYGSMRFTKKEWVNLTYDPLNFKQAVGEGVCKLIYIDNRDEKHLNRIREKIDEIEKISIMSSWVNNIEIMPTGVNKGTATQELADMLKIPKENVMALGDQENDIEMLAYAGYGIAMGNAVAHVAAIAKYQTGHHQQDGVAQAVYRYALKHRF